MNSPIKEKAREAALDMMKRVRFIDEKRQHRYETLDGQWLQGVSTVSSIIPKDWLSAWGAKEAVKALGYSDYDAEKDMDFAREMMAKISSFKEPKEYIAFLKEAKGASARKSKAALLDGTKGHEWLESWVKAKMRGEEIPKIPEGMLERPLKQFVAWSDENVDYWILSEAMVANPEHRYAGTMDGMAMMKNGLLAVIDYKFASHISEDYYLQTAGYQACFETYGLPIGQRIIVRLPKTLEREEYDPKTHTYSMVPNDLEVRIVPTVYEQDRDVFFACLPVKMWINQFIKHS